MTINQLSGLASSAWSRWCDVLIADPTDQEAARYLSELHGYIMALMAVQSSQRRREFRRAAV